MPFLTNALRQARLTCLSTAWVAAVLAILTAQPDGAVASLGAAAFGIFILLTVARLRWDSLVILVVLSLVTWMLLDELPDGDALLAGGRRVLIFAALLPTMALVRATAMTMPSSCHPARLGALPPAPLGTAAGGPCIWWHHQYRCFRANVRGASR